MSSKISPTMFYFVYFGFILLLFIVAYISHYFYKKEREEIEEGFRRAGKQAEAEIVNVIRDPESGSVSVTYKYKDNIGNTEVDYQENPPCNCGIGDIVLIEYVPRGCSTTRFSNYSTIRFKIYDGGSGLWLYQRKESNSAIYFKKY